jgi:hypothetical protein
LSFFKTKFISSLFFKYYHFFLVLVPSNDLESGSTTDKHPPSTNSPSNINITDENEIKPDEEEPLNLENNQNANVCSVCASKKLNDCSINNPTSDDKLGKKYYLFNGYPLSKISFSFHLKIFSS